MQEKETDAAETPLSLLETLGSVLAAAIGVRSNHNRERDFRRGSVHRYIFIGIAATLSFVLLVYAAVKLILAIATP